MSLVYTFTRLKKYSFYQFFVILVGIRWLI